MKKNYKMNEDFFIQSSNFKLLDNIRHDDVKLKIYLLVLDHWAVSQC